MKETPVLFSGAMVRVILSGTKTQTRRILRRQPSSVEYWLHGEHSDSTHGLPTLRDQDGKGWAMCGPFTCPFGKAGDRILAKEDRGDRTINEYAAYYGTPSIEVRYLADGKACPDSWLPSIHMPRWASRITLEIVAVRAQRLQEISEEDAKAEGVEPWNFKRISADQCLTSGERALDSPYRSGFALLWDELYEDIATWKSNPFVWAISFRKIERGAL